MAMGSARMVLEEVVCPELRGVGQLDLLGSDDQLSVPELYGCEHA
jgi:hypothetical protein